MKPLVEPVRLAEDGATVRIIDQRRLPGALVERDLATLDEVIEAITSLSVRGAPAIGLCAAAGLAVVMRAHVRDLREEFLAALASKAARLANSRPTAVNLAWAVKRCVARARETPGGSAEMLRALGEEARAIRDEDLAMSDAIGAHGLTLIGNAKRVLTHCNTGALATAGLGTALAPLYAARESGRLISVFATETRPLLQGARLTSWELQRAGIPVTVLVDSAAASLMRDGEIDAVLVGADRITANGDTANKIGTYSLAVSASYHGIPFYVFAPWSTVDVHTPDGATISIEQRSREEVASLGGAQILPDGVPAWTPAFDVTPAALITAIVTDRGVHRPPYAFE